MRFWAVSSGEEARGGVIGRRVVVRIAMEFYPGVFGVVGWMEKVFETCFSTDQMLGELFCPFWGLGMRAIVCASCLGCGVEMGKRGEVAWDLINR